MPSTDHHQCATNTSRDCTGQGQAGGGGGGGAPAEAVIQEEGTDEALACGHHELGGWVGKGGGHGDAALYEQGGLHGSRVSTSMAVAHCTYMPAASSLQLSMASTACT